MLGVISYEIPKDWKELEIHFPQNYGEVRTLYLLQQTQNLLNNKLKVNWK